MVLKQNEQTRNGLLTSDSVPAQVKIHELGKGSQLVRNKIYPRPAWCRNTLLPTFDSREWNCQGDAPQRDMTRITPREAGPGLNLLLALGGRP